MNEARLANEAWEALFRAQVALLREFAHDDVWNEVTEVEYDVLYTLSKAPAGMSMVELNRGILMTQGGVSRLIARLEADGLVKRTPDQKDKRAACVALTDKGKQVQRTVGCRHAAAVTAVMTQILDTQKMGQLKDLGNEIIEALDASPVTRPLKKTP